ncbi:hypothetical protein [Tabrizicola sp.]|uniref:hypothetical protein n=1 Tax=Tabrizicola sp. TaxID=2005166 RepID=UPI001A61E52A|nr:hypothetical protein [Tabrizicola sp.]MBL9074923.1 hypothetical protein [Tabrizicola sp.]
MRARWTLALCLAAMIAGPPADANRLTFEVWPDASPDHAVFCTFALSDGWISLVQVTGAGMPGPEPMRWRASRAEVDALSDSLQAFVGGALGSVDPYLSRPPPAPFLTVTWMTRLDDRLKTGLYIQPGLALPDPLSRTLASLGLARPCGFSATAGE